VWGFTTGLVGWFNGYLYADLLASMSLISLVYVSIVWWRVLRNPFTKDTIRAVQTGIRYGMILFIVSEMMLFLSFLGFGHSSLAPTIELAGVWPPRGIVMDPFGIPLLNTFILLTSGASVTWAHYAILLADRKQAAMGLWITILLAAIFTGVPRLRICQCRVHNQRLRLWKCILYAYGLHGLHVLIGTIFGICLSVE
jgi:cytochrome c oxidase subunit 3